MAAAATDSDFLSRRSSVRSSCLLRSGSSRPVESDSVWWDPPLPIPPQVDVVGGPGLAAHGLFVKWLASV